MADALSTILETTQAERLATGFGFTEGPLWDPTNGCYYFVDLRRNRLHESQSRHAAQSPPDSLEQQIESPRVGARHQAAGAGYAPSAAVRRQLLASA